MCEYLGIFHAWLLGKKLMKNGGVTVSSNFRIITTSWLLHQFHLSAYLTSSFNNAHSLTLRCQQVLSSTCLDTGYFSEHTPKLPHTSNVPPGCSSSNSKVQRDRWSFAWCHGSCLHNEYYHRSSIRVVILGHIFVPTESPRKTSRSLPSPRLRRVFFGISISFQYSPIWSL